MSHRHYGKRQTRRFTVRGTIDMSELVALAAGLPTRWMSRRAWVRSVNGCRLQFKFYVSNRPEVGERYYIERLPSVRGDVGIVGGEFRRPMTTFHSLRFVNGADDGGGRR